MEDNKPHGTRRDGAVSGEEEKGRSWQGENRDSSKGKDQQKRRCLGIHKEPGLSETREDPDLSEPRKHPDHRSPGKTRNTASPRVAIKPLLMIALPDVTSLGRRKLGLIGHY